MNCNFKPHTQALCNLNLSTLEVSYSKDKNLISCGPSQFTYISRNREHQSDNNIYT